MPVHDWTRVQAGLFHHFHQRWMGAMSDALNLGGLPPGYEAFIEQKTPKVEPDLIALELGERAGRWWPGADRGAALLEAPPRASIVVQTQKQTYAKKADRLVIKHPNGRVVAVIEVVSPGNKDGQVALRSFVEKAVDFLRGGIHLLIVDLFPPTRRDPNGVARVIWDELDEDTPFELPAARPLAVASFMADAVPRAYVEPLAVGDELPALPIFLAYERYVPAPLEETYMATWNVCPGSLKAELAESIGPEGPTSLPARGQDD